MLWIILRRSRVVFVASNTCSWHNFLNFNQNLDQFHFSIKIYKGNYGHFAAGFDPVAGVFQGVEGDTRAQRHRFRIIRPEELVCLVRFRGLAPVLAQIEHYFRKRMQFFPKTDWPKTRKSKKKQKAKEREQQEENVWINQFLRLESPLWNIFNPMRLNSINQWQLFENHPVSKL